MEAVNAIRPNNSQQSLFYYYSREKQYSEVFIRSRYQLKGEICNSGSAIRIKNQTMRRLNRLWVDYILM